MNETALGFESNFESFHFFFGKKDSQLANLQLAYPHLRFLRLKQTHSNLIREVDLSTPDFQIEGDGLISNVENLALCSITADCIPVLMICPKSGWFGAFHAGWRGVASKIVPLGIEALLKKGADLENIQVWIGPHILQQSFEVDSEVRDQILQSLSPKSRQSPTLFYFEDVKKSRVSLVQVLIDQIREKGISLHKIEMELEDTKTNPDFHSARRDRENSGRQISWVARLGQDFGR